ncbi:BlaI/MecI/CopY family transcriptional regulator [Thalassotalea litorea]|uniref:BlaI/MecI/CopY family transcriptional regulator n=1 Tax=Thalassotalea litorea TaxID=2020715 RepID=A0A5R9IJV4_9GAMM|nr:BlaI/MecI/CopY family transcriptional regulator [Thalassotalea litorea]TLU65805.1 BlaI/MecI/CopY family transcriptional regulator [Thalassotalea litorea]
MASPIRKPTEAELSLLTILWEIGPATVRQVHQAHNDTLPEDQHIGYTTVLKILQIMHEKSLVLRDERQRAHIYVPSESAVQTQSSLVKDLVQKAFNGSLSQLVMRAIGNSTNANEISDIRSMLDELEQTQETVR